METETPTREAEPAQPGAASETAFPSPSPVAATATQPPEAPVVAANRLWVDPRLPAGVQTMLALPPGWALANAAEDADGRLVPGGDGALGAWVYALVTPFASLDQGVSAAELSAAWRGEAAGAYAGRPLLVDENTLGVFTAVWGAPAEGAVRVLPVEELLPVAWGSSPSWAIVPFERLEPRWKVLEIDGKSPLRKDFDPAGWPLVVPYSIEGRAPETDGWIPDGNRKPERLTVLAMTGVTALVRATAFTMERQGIQYPGLDVAPFLQAADITHISNEVPFASGCPFPDPVQQGMRFCSDPRYIGLLEAVGTDVVELTGDHFQDWGADAMLETLGLYQERGWGYYGGGADLDEARKPFIIEHNGNRLAFIGCNAKGGGYAQAAPGHPGAGACGNFEWIEQEIARLRSEGYLPIVTFQHFEYYTYQAQPNQRKDSRAMAEAGAVIVSGSQAHQPQAFEFDEGALIHYGLGNLFFDQYEVSYATRQGFIDFHVFYENRHIGTELLPILFIDYARPRVMTAEERNELLRAVFSASGW